MTAIKENIISFSHSLSKSDSHHLVKINESKHGNIAASKNLSITSKIFCAIRQLLNSLNVRGNVIKLFFTLVTVPDAKITVCMFQPNYQHSWIQLILFQESFAFVLHFN